MQSSHSTRARKTQLPDHAKAERTARHMIDKAFAESDRLDVQIFPEHDAKLPPGVSVNWRIGREAGITFHADERETAIAWTVAILKSGWTFFRV